MTATKDNTTVKPVPHKADAALCFPSALKPWALGRALDARALDAISPCT